MTNAEPIVIVGHEGKPIIMEVIGKKGQKLREYIPKATETTDVKPYYILEESATI